MNGTFRSPLEPDQDPAQNPKVQRLLRALDPGATYTLTIHAKPIIVHGSKVGIRGRFGCYESERHVEIHATGGKPRSRPLIRIPAALRDHKHHDPPPTLEQLEQELKWAWGAYRNSTNPTPENNRLHELEIEHLEEMVKLAQIQRFGQIVEIATKL